LGAERTGLRIQLTNARFPENPVRRLYAEQLPGKALGDPVQRSPPIKSDMRGVSPVMPVTELFPAWEEPTADTEDSSPSQQGIDTREFPAGIVKMLRRFGAEDEVIVKIEQLGPRKKIGIVGIHREALSLEEEFHSFHRTTAEIQSVTSGSHGVFHALGKAPEIVPVLGTI
jgi:hypothetical protein